MTQRIYRRYTIDPVLAAATGTGKLSLGHKAGMIRQIAAACDSTDFDLRLGTKTAFADDDISQVFRSLTINKWLVDNDQPVFFHNTYAAEPADCLTELYYRVKNDDGVTTGDIELILTIDIEPAVLESGTATAD
ncbi:MAG: hypothetical protein JRI80_00250 [Deltaproteobacteria bacterium]|nr:hypothetical protein [Deltaproteobacteria bacterium]